jgi:PAS domain S-box-containing protein
VLSDPKQPDNPIVHCNDAFVSLTGYARSEIIGRNCRFLSGPNTEIEMTEKIRLGVRNQQPVLVEITNYRKDGASFRNAVFVAPIFGEDGKVAYFLGSQTEIPNGDHPAPRLIASERVTSLTPRQQQILRGLAAGKLNKQLAFELQLTERTIKMHRAAMLKALGVRSTADAIRIAFEAGY